jgi:Na+/H+ antiporter NhaC
MVIFISINVIPIIFLSILYAGIVYMLWHPDKRISSETATHSKHQKTKNFVEKTRRKTTIMLLTVVMVFFLCMFPYNLLTMLLTFGNTKKINFDILLHANSILRLLLLVNSASNPIIYNFLGEKFRKGFRSILASLTKRRQNRVN